MRTLDDPGRVRTLRQTGLLDTRADEALDRLTRLVRDILDVPVSTVTLVEPERQLFVGASGLREPWATDGWQVAYLGADTPVADAFELAERVGAGIVCLSVAMPEHVIALEDALRRAQPPSSLHVVLGGRGVDAIAAARLGVTHVDSSLRHSVRALRRLAA
jgi:hypothetical protein